MILKVRKFCLGEKGKTSRKPYSWGNKISGRSPGAEEKNGWHSSKALTGSCSGSKKLQSTVRSGHSGWFSVHLKSSAG